MDDSSTYTKMSKKMKMVVRVPEEFKPLWNGGDSIVKRQHHQLLTKQRINDKDILKYNIGYCDEGLYSNRIIVPSYDSDGQLNFFVGRDFYNSKLKYRNSPTSKDIIGFDLFINWDEPIILCEGVFDFDVFQKKFNSFIW